MTLEYKVPRLLWENLESVLLAHARRYIGELANHLNVPEKELQKHVLPTADSLKVILQDSQAESNQCKAYVQQSQLTVMCKRPVAYHSEFCTFHRTKRMMVIEGTNPAIIQRIKDKSTAEPLWMVEQNVVNAEGSIVGKINTTKQALKLFTVVNESSA